MHGERTGPNPSGLCMCGCGQPTKLAPQTQASKGWIKGTPMRFLRGHGFVRSGNRWRVEDRGYETPCWIWQLTTSNGYGRSYDRARQRPIRAHIAAYVAANGPVPAGLQIDHLCRQRACVNPAHLEAVTPAENTRRGSKTKLRATDVSALRVIALNTTLSHAAIADLFGVSRGHVRDIVRGKRWR